MHTCIVVTNSEPTRTSVALSLKAKGIEPILLPSVSELQSTLKVTPASGILLEVGAVITASHADKKTLQEYLELYPSAKFRHLNGQILIVGETIDKFAARVLDFAPRILRRSVRREIFLALQLSANPSFKPSEKTITVNISDDGFFVMSMRRWKVGSRVWLRFLHEDDIISGTVHSIHPWGNNRFIPGIGIVMDHQSRPKDKAA